MSVNVANDSCIISSSAKAVKLKERNFGMKSNSEILTCELTKLLNEKLSKSEVCQLNDEGFKIKNPTRKTALMIALYKKGISGDLSAIKEIRSIVSGSENEANKEAVIIVDDI